MIQTEAELRQEWGEERYDNALAEVRKVVSSSEYENFSVDDSYRLMISRAYHGTAFCKECGWEMTTVCRLCLLKRARRPPTSGM